MADRHWTAVLAGLLLLIAAGCSTRTPGEASAAFPGTDDRYGAPSVPSPLNASTFLTNPCAVLTPVQLKDLDLTGPGTPDTSGQTADYAGPSCSWQNGPTGNFTLVAFTTTNRNGLADLYRGHAEGRFRGYWEPATVDGYPAVFKGENDNRGNGDCSLSVGLSDTLEMLVDHQERIGPKACDRNKQIAGLVLTTIRAGG